MEIYIGRSATTGTYHKAISRNTTCCNYSGQRRTGRNNKATETQIAAAPETAFCKKCFPNGKPNHPAK